MNQWIILCPNLNERMISTCGGYQALGCLLSTLARFRLNYHANLYGQPFYYLLGNVDILFIYQRTNGPVNAHLISLPNKAQNIQNLEKYMVKK